jgi:signal transduction histidine kinase
LKFTFEGSIKINLGYDIPSGKLKVIVTDTGIGINDADKHKIFEMFSKIETTLTSNTSGIGMGLSISRKILSGLGGTIQIEP